MEKLNIEYLKTLKWEESYRTTMESSYYEHKRGYIFFLRLPKKEMYIWLTDNEFSVNGKKIEVVKKEVRELYDYLENKRKELKKEKNLRFIQEIKKFKILK